MRFSERHGYSKIRKAIQLESMDESLRVGLWNALKIFVWDKAAYSSSAMGGGYYLTASANAELKNLCDRLWFNYFKKPLDTLGSDWSEVHHFLRTYYFDAEWFQVYDFVEFVATNYKRPETREKLIDACNSVLEKEKSGYRFLNNQIAPITAQEQLNEIQRAIDNSTAAEKTHLERALELLSERDKPDYRNSIKESISAVESLVVRVTGEKGTLGQLLKHLEEKIGLHPALKNGYSHLYGYTSDEGGIRHAILEAPKVGFEEAKFFLVVCSAFINFVQSKMGLSRQGDR